MVKKSVNTPLEERFCLLISKYIFLFQKIFFREINFTNLVIHLLFFLYSFKMTASTTIATLLIQALMFLLLFVKIFIYGEKVTDQESVKSSLKKYWIHKKQAELTPNNPHKAMNHLSLALEAIGRPMPQSKFEWITFCWILEWEAKAILKQTILCCRLSLHHLVIWGAKGLCLL